MLTEYVTPPIYQPHGGGLVTTQCTATARNVYLLVCAASVLEPESQADPSGAGS